MYDLKLALRQFRKSPGFAATVILTISLGIGANTAIFTLVHAILLKSLPVANPATLYRIGDQGDCCVEGLFINENGDFDIFSYDLYRHFQDSTPEFEQLAAFQSGGNMMNVRTGPVGAKAERSEYVSGNYFSTFGLGAYAGRMLLPSDDVPGATPVAVLSYQAWQAAHAGDPNVVGATFYMQNQPVTIVGIAPPGFFGDRINSDPPAFWIPLNAEPILEGQTSILKQPDTNWLYALGRVKPGVNPESLQAKLSNELRQWLSTQPAYTTNGNQTQIPKQHVVVAPGGAGIQNLQQETSSGLHLLMSISGLVLLVACANIANLLLAKGATRRAETSISMALGAARSRLIRQMLVESVLLGCAGGIIGLGVAYAGARMILTLAFPDSPQLPIHASPSPIVLAFAFALSLLTGVVFGIVPAWISSHSDPAEALRGVNRSTRDRASLPQKSLIVFQAALSLVLLVGAGLLTQSLRNLQHQDFGIATANRYVFHFDPAGAGYTIATIPAFNERLEREFSTLPGIQSVGVALYSTLEGNNWGEGVNIEGRPLPGPEDNTGSSWDRVSPHFFETVGQSLLRGRGFTEQDTATSPMVAVVNQAFVKKFFPKEDPIGRRFGTSGQKSSYEIVGILADAKYTNPRDPVRSMYFRPMAQLNTTFTERSAMTGEARSLFPNSVTLRFTGDSASLESLVRRTLTNINPNLTIIDFRSLDYQVAGNFNQERLITRLTALFGILALVLASVGLYGITAYSVARRTSEIGLRMALGANRSNVVALVLQGAAWQVGIGLAIGIPVALLGGRLMASQLYGVSTYDPLTLVAAVLVLSVFAAIAGLIPARRAASIEPMNALRTD
ncbi:MAG TPA: ABC transporter permease [Candidatus Sulfotelmatobacter sp.]|nr:ABC transporter permease [Candidatus Sulfotelmatobacter sp.]